jgi:hypothetical protein
MPEKKNSLSSYCLWSFYCLQAAAAETKEEQESARNRRTKLLLEEFKTNAKPGTEFFGAFYALTKAINRALG